MASEQMAATIDLLKQIGPLDVNMMTVESMRAVYDQIGDAYPPAAETLIEEVDLAGIAAEKITRGTCDSSRAILYLHGGGYVIGSLKSHRELASRLALVAGCVVYLLDYPLAPEHPYPAALDAARAGFGAIAGSLPAGLSVAGDSAGGGLAAALLLAMRDAGGPQPRACALLSPWLDMTMSGQSFKTRAAADPLVDLAQLEQWVTYYAVDLDSRTPLVSPLFGDLAGLPPVYAQVGTREVLYDDAVRFIDRAREAGVDATMDAFDGCIHVFQQFSPDAPESQDALGRLSRFFGRHWGSADELASGHGLGRWSSPSS